MTKEGTTSLPHTHMESLTPELKKIRRQTHKTIDKVSRDIGTRFHFNTAISALMEFVNVLYAMHDTLKEPASLNVTREAIRSLILLIAPFTPHMADELWEKIGEKGRVANENWPEYDPDADVADEVLIIVQVNGKLRQRITVDAGTTENEVKKRVFEDSKMQEVLDGKSVRKFIYIPDRLVNIVV
ncbi:MAG: class I tRNA ligase family protein [Nitrospinota bacterium]